MNRQHALGRRNTFNSTRENVCFLFLVAVPDSLLALLIVFGWLMYICLVCLGIGRQIKVLNEGERAPEASLEESEKNTKKQPIREWHCLALVQWEGLVSLHIQGLIQPIPARCTKVVRGTITKPLAKA